MEKEDSKLSRFLLSIAFVVLMLMVFVEAIMNRMETGERKIEYYRKCYKEIEGEWMRHEDIFEKDNVLSHQLSEALMEWAEEGISSFYYDVSRERILETLRPYLSGESEYLYISYLENDGTKDYKERSISAIIFIALGQKGYDEISPTEEYKEYFGKIKYTSLTQIIPEDMYRALFYIAEYLHNEGIDVDEYDLYNAWLDKLYKLDKVALVEELRNNYEKVELDEIIQNKQRNYNLTGNILTCNEEGQSKQIELDESQVEKIWDILGRGRFNIYKSNYDSSNENEAFYRVVIYTDIYNYEYYNKEEMQELPALFKSWFE